MWDKYCIVWTMGWQVGSVVRALGWRSKGQGFESRQEHKENFFWVKKVVLTRCQCAQLDPCVYTHAHEDHVFMLKILRSPCPSSVDYGNTKITSVHLHPRRRNVAAQVAEELRTVTCTTPPMQKGRKKVWTMRQYLFPHATVSVSVTCVPCTTVHVVVRDSSLSVTQTLHACFFKNMSRSETEIAYQWCWPFGYIIIYSNTNSIYIYIYYMYMYNMYNIWFIEFNWVDILWSQKWDLEQWLAELFWR